MKMSNDNTRKKLSKNLNNDQSDKHREGSDKKLYSMDQRLLYQYIHFSFSLDERALTSLVILSESKKISINNMIESAILPKRSREYLICETDDPVFPTKLDIYVSRKRLLEILGFLNLRTIMKEQQYDYDIIEAKLMQKIKSYILKEVKIQNLDNELSQKLDSIIYKKQLIYRPKRKTRNIPSPIRVYLDSDANKVMVAEGIYNVLNALGLEVSSEFDERISSWYKEWFVKKMMPLFIKELEQDFLKAKKAIELKQIDKIVSENDKILSEAMRNLIESISANKYATIQMRSLLIIKRPANDGESEIIIKSLSPNEQLYLENNTQLLENPEQLISALKNINKLINDKTMDRQEQCAKSSTSENSFVILPKVKDGVSPRRFS